MQRSSELLARILVLAIVAAMFVGSGSVSAQQAPRIAGIYSSMHYIPEAGDVLGEEIKIVASGKGYRGFLQFAEGSPSEVIEVDVKVVGATVSFVIPDDNFYAGQFAGTVVNGVLKGKFRFKNGGSEKVALRKGKSYWDKRPTN